MNEPFPLFDAATARQRTLADQDPDVLKILKDILGDIQTAIFLKRFCTQVEVGDEEPGSDDGFLAVDECLRALGYFVEVEPCEVDVGEYKLMRFISWSLAVNADLPLR